MTANQFDNLCASLGIDPGVALENDDVAAALRARDDAEVERILREDF